MPRKYKCSLCRLSGHTISSCPTRSRVAQPILDGGTLTDNNLPSSSSDFSETDAVKIYRKKNTATVNKKKLIDNPSCSIKVPIDDFPSAIYVGGVIEPTGRNSSIIQSGSNHATDTISDSNSESTSVLPNSPCRSCRKFRTAGHNSRKCTVVTTLLSSTRSHAATGTSVGDEASGIITATSGVDGFAMPLTLNQLTESIARVLRPRCSECRNPGCANFACVVPTSVFPAGGSQLVTELPDKDPSVESLDNFEVFEELPPVNLDIDNREEVDGRVDIPDTFEANFVCDECSCCHRISIEGYQLNLQAPPVDVMRGVFGDRVSGGRRSLVCEECCYYVDKRHNFTDWGHAWPAVIYSYLTKDGILDDPMKFVQMLPYSFREMWQRCVDKLSSSVCAAWDVEPLFVDETVRLLQYRKDIAKYLIGPLRKALDATCIPQVMCPMGCFCNMTESVGTKVTLMPAKHYLALISQKFSSFRANSSYYAGARPDWPNSVVLFEKWPVCPTIFVDKELGMCIMQCGPEVHSDGRRKYIHVPKNPVLGSKSPLYPDVLAPVTICPKFVRSGRSNQQNTSYVVLKQQGGSSGLSTFNLTVQPPLNMPATDTRDVDSWALALKNRPEIPQTWAETSVNYKEWCKRVLNRSDLSGSCPRNTD